MRALYALRLKLLQAEDILLVGLLLITLGLAVLQIILRNVFDSGITWVEPLLRITVLWIGMVGAMFASRDDSHIKIDLGMRMLHPKYQPFARAAVYLFTATVCGIAAWYCFEFVREEYTDGGMAFAAIPVWLTESIMPLGFAIIALRYVISTVLLFADIPLFTPLNPKQDEAEK